jgi:hypothetical protein
MCRQIHGFLYEEHIINKYRLVKSPCYTSKFDAYTETNIPVQIKCIKKGSSIEMGDYYRNMTISSSFYLVLGYWNSCKTEIVSEQIHYIDIDVYKKHVCQNTQWILSSKKEMNWISNSKKDDAKWSEFVKKYKKLHCKKSLLQPRFKRDHKVQKRIQCAINNKCYQTVFCKLFKPLKEIIH